MSILMVAGIEGARNCADVVAKHLGMEAEVADGRKAAIRWRRTLSGIEPGWPFRCRSTLRFQEQLDLFARSAPHCAGATGNRCWRARPPQRPLSRS